MEPPIWKSSFICRHALNKFCFFTDFPGGLPIVLVFEERKMGTPRLVRVNELLKREIAEDIQRNYAMSDFDSGSVTVTRVECAPDLRDANVFISIFGHEDEREDMIGYLNRHRQEIVRMMIKRVKLKYTPRLHFVLDESIEGGDRILSLLADMERENPEAFKDDEERYEES